MATATIHPFAPQPRLPLDVQLVLAESCPDVPTLLALVSSHKTLREHGAHLALQLPNARVAPQTSDALYSFLRFLDPPRPQPTRPLPSRIAHLHTLDLSLAIVPEVGIECLTVVFAHTPALSSLTLRDPEPELANHAPLYAALQRLTTLKTLHAFAAGPTTRRLFAEIASPLEDVTIVHDASPLNADVPLEIERFLLPHRTTLTRLCATRATPFIRPDGIAAAMGPAPASAVFENVRELAIDDFAWDGAPEFLDAFPNLVTLDVGRAVSARYRLSPGLEHLRERNKWTNGGTMDDDTDARDELVHRLEMMVRPLDMLNLGLEMVHHEEFKRILVRTLEDEEMRDEDEDGAHGEAGENDVPDEDEDEDEEDDDDELLAWESLEHVRGGLLDLYVFGSSCAVRTLIIDGLIEGDWACVPAVVADHRPRVLHMTVSSSVEVDTWDWTNFAGVRDLCLKIVVADGVYDEQRLVDTILRIATAFTFCSSFCFNIVGQSEQSCPLLNRFDHVALVSRVFRGLNRMSPKFRVVTPSGTTIWTPKVRMVDEEASTVEVHLVLTEQIYA